MYKLLLVMVFLLTSTFTQAGTVDDRRATALAEQLRCLVCQNQTLADSNAELAVDLKKQLHEKIASGWTDQQIIDFMVQRYGDFILYRPPFKPITWLLWLGPFLMLLAGLFWLRLKFIRRPELAVHSEQELARAAAILNDR